MNTNRTKNRKKLKPLSIPYGKSNNKITTAID